MYSAKDGEDHLLGSELCKGCANGHEMRLMTRYSRVLPVLGIIKTDPTFPRFEDAEGWVCPFALGQSWSGALTFEY